MGIGAMAYEMASNFIRNYMNQRADQKKIRVIAVIPGNGEGSSMIFCKRQVESLRKLGIDVREFYLVSRINPLVLAKEFFRLRRVIKEFRPDILHAHYGTMTSFLCAITSSVPLVITFRGSDLNYVKNDGIIRNSIGKILSHISVLFAQGIICVSRKLSKKIFWKRDCIEIIPSGVNIYLFRPMPQGEARAKLGWDPSERIVLFNANNPKVKRLDIAQEAVSMAKKEIPAIRLEVLNGSVSPDEMPWYLNGADCLLLCSDSEGSPNIVKEALACNLPIVSTDVGDVAERLQGVVQSKIVLKDHEALSNAIVEILRISKRSNGRAMIKCHHISEEDVAQAVLRLYQRVLFRVNPVVSMKPTEAFQRIKDTFPFPEYIGSIYEGTYINIAKTVLRHLESGSRILDFGAGPCDKTAVLQLLGFRCVAYDDLQDHWHKVGNNAAKILEFARSQRIEFVVAKNSYMPFEKESFDLVMMNSVIEHFHDSPRETMNDLVELIRPGGYLLITTPNAVNIRKRISVLFGKTNLSRFELHYWNPGPWRGHIREYVKDDLIKLAKFLDLDIIELRSSHHMLNRLPQFLRPFYCSVTFFVPGWRDTWILVAKKRIGWMPRRAIPREEQNRIFQGKPSYQ